MSIIIKKGDCYFKQYMVEDHILIPTQMPRMENVNSILVDSNIIDFEEINTPLGLSCENQNLTGKELIFTIKLTKRINYTSDDICQSIHSFLSYSYHRVSLVVPKLIHGCCAISLVYGKLLRPKLLIEHVNWQVVDSRCIFNGISIFIELYTCPTYILSYAESCNNINSSLYIDYKDCSNAKQLVYFDDIFIYSIKWSLDGKKIAFIGFNDLGSSLFVSYVDSFSTFQLTTIHDFEGILDFNWCNDSDKIVFSASIENTIEIYSINIFSCKYSKLTTSSSCSYCYNPKYSVDFDYISYLKVGNVYSNIYLKSIINHNEIELTKSEEVLDYAWVNKDSIIYMSSSNTQYLELNFVNINNRRVYSLFKINNCLKIRKFIMSPDKKYLSFIGTYYDVENIYLFILDENKFISLTNYNNFVQIVDFDWSLDSHEIIFSSSELEIYTLHLISIFDKDIINLKTINSINTSISFRPKIL